MKEFNCSQEVATLGLSFFIWGLGLSRPNSLSEGVCVSNIGDRCWPAISQSTVRGKCVFENASTYENVTDPM